MAIRLALISGHYRSDRTWTDDLLTAAHERLDRWRRAAAAPAGPSGAELLAEVRARLADDLDTPGALARRRSPSWTFGRSRGDAP